MSEMARNGNDTLKRNEMKVFVWQKSGCELVYQPQYVNVLPMFSKGLRKS